ncbi:4-amino-4-deoxychorismate lyase [Brevibacterium sanguinis]|uniref:4-amino-4-deoxychorismate lyase n=2 Tax=Brevibacterium TaxID=1696 RepID=A0A366IN51_9MICO|nr:MULTISPECIES: aminotransferase class IV [Brevibacterium]RBP67070.1 4-amino-4-deoxychorismate lyase [Brevibacterium sanguinis]RBP73595.1 4-amino-4-deoxychorismate lyase [Brevibacterium celere]
MTDALVLIDPSASSLELADLGSAQLPVDDLSAHRGDGIFETVLVRVDEPSGDAVVVARDRHFARFRDSASALDLPDPDPALWNRALDTVIAEVRAQDPESREFGVRYTFSRGLDSPRGWAFGVPIGEAVLRARAEGISAISLDRGYDAYLGGKAPWLLIGAKTISYAINQAAGRYAAERGADEALFVSHDGIVLEGPTSNLIIRRGDRLLTPDPAAGLLWGTTQRLIFDHAGELGLGADYADLRLDDIRTADGAWFVSSMRTAVALTSLDGAPISRDDALTRALQQIIGTG